MTLSVPALQSVTSGRFKAWAYDSKNHWLFVMFPPSPRARRGSVVYYEHVAPEQWEEAQEAASKGKWLEAEIIQRKDRHPFHYVNGVEVEVIGAEDEHGPKRTNSIVENIVRGGGFVGRNAPLDSRALGDEEIRRTSSNGEFEAGPASLEDMQHIPAEIRDVAQLPRYDVPTMPVILPPSVNEGEQKPFTQVVRERALAIAKSLPALMSIPDIESYRGLGAALVVIKTERRAVEDALEMISRPIIDMKRDWDDYKKAVLLAYDSTEKKIDQALRAYRRDIEERAKKREAEIRRQNEEESKARAAEASKAETARVQEQARQLEADALRRKEEAATPAEKEQAVADLSRAEQLKQTEVIVSPKATPPVHVQREDVSVPGLRKKPPSWTWEADPDALAIEPQEGQPLTRKHFKHPEQIPDEYWVLDQTAINGVVRNTKGLCQIHGIRTYDKNNQ